MSSQPLPEAAFSLSLRGHLHGVEATLTVRGMTYPEFAANIVAVQGLLDPLPASLPAALTPGTAPEPPAQPPLEGWCPVHQCQMTLQSNERGSWYSHKTAEGWCRGKARKSA